MRNKTTAGILALFGGWIGLHRFYLGQPILGILYILFMATGISLLLGLIDALSFFGMEERRFDYKYNRESGRTRARARPMERRRPSSAPRRKTNTPPSRTAQRTRSVRKKNPYKETGLRKYENFDMQEAIDDFAKSLEMDPKDADIHFRKASAHSILEQTQEAFHHLRQAVSLDPSYREKMMNEDALAFVRIQEEFQTFLQTKKSLPQEVQEKEQTLSLQDDILLQQLNKLKELRGKGILTDEEFLQEKRKLTR